MRGDGLVKLWLGELGFIPFVVPIFSVAQKVNEDVPVEGLSVLKGDFHDLDHRFYIVGIDMKHQGLSDFRHIGAIGRGAGIEIVRGEANLVVHHNVDRPSRSVAVKPSHLGQLVDHTLAGNGSVPMDQNGQHTCFLSSHGIDACPCDAFDHRVNCLQMRGVGRQRDGHFLP